MTRATTTTTCRRWPPARPAAHDGGTVTNPHSEGRRRDVAMAIAFTNVPLLRLAHVETARLLSAGALRRDTLQRDQTVRHIANATQQQGRPCRHTELFLDQSCMRLHAALELGAPALCNILTHSGRADTPQASQVRRATRTHGGSFPHLHNQKRLFLDVVLALANALHQVIHKLLRCRRTRQRHLCSHTSACTACGHTGHKAQ